jgi:Sulfotransferase family
MKQNNSTDHEFLKKIQNQSFSPIFILGLHRSGTSILYKTLGDTQQFNILTAYHIFFYDSLLYNSIHHLEKTKKDELDNLFRQKGITTRKTDNMLVSAEYAYEYMFIFLNHGYAYKITKKNKTLFEEIYNKIKFISGNENPILFKNPFDFSNFIFIKQIYPNARFIFIHRNPLQVLSSTMRLYQSIYKNKNEYLATFSKIYRQSYDNKLSLFLSRLFYCSYFPPGVFDAIHSCSKNIVYYLNNIGQLSNNDYISVKYEDFCKEPSTEISKIMKFLGFDNDFVCKNPIQQRKLDLVPEVEFLKEYINKKMDRYLHYMNYPD